MMKTVKKRRYMLTIFIRFKIMNNTDMSHLFHCKTVSTDRYLKTITNHGLKNIFFIKYAEI